jgi:hypothetical protein
MRTEGAFDRREPGAGRPGGAPAQRAAPREAPARPSGWRAVLALPELRRAVVFVEVLGSPRSLRGWED